MAASHGLWPTALLDEEHRPMLEFYIYDYLIRKNMHQTAGILMKDANVSYTKAPVGVINPPEGMLAKWWRTNYEEVDFFKEMMHKSHTPRKALKAKGKQTREGKQGRNASQSGTHPMNVQANKHLLNKVSSSMSRGTKAMQPTGLHVMGSDHVSQGFLPCSYELDLLTLNLGKCTPISYAKIVHQLEPVFCALEINKNASYEDKEMDPEIQHLINTLFWEVDNCPPPLLGEITLKVKGTTKTSASPRKLRRVYKITDLFSDLPTVLTMENFARNPSIKILKEDI